MHNTHDMTKTQRDNSLLIQEFEAGFNSWVSGLRSIQPVAVDTQPEELGKGLSARDLRPERRSHDDGRWQDDGGAGTHEGCE